MVLLTTLARRIEKRNVEDKDRVKRGGKKMIDSQLWYPLHSPKICKEFREFYQAYDSEGVLDKKTRELVVLALASTFRCADCTEKHIQNAFEAGATEAEVSETVRLASIDGVGDKALLGGDSFGRPQNECVDSHGTISI
jgi:AhpD family alkylhydroperoxidase